MALDGDPRRPRHSRRARRSISSSAAGMRRSRVRCRASTGSKRSTPHWLARDGEGARAAPAAAHGVELARPPLRSRDQLRARHPQQPRARPRQARRWTAGWASGGGAPVLDVAFDYDPGAHDRQRAAAGPARLRQDAAPESTRPLLVAPGFARRRLRLPSFDPRTGRPLVGVHVSGGRAIKQWPPNDSPTWRRAWPTTRGAVIVLTGAPGDRALVSRSAGRSRAAPRDRRLGGRWTCSLGGAPRRARRADHRRHGPDAPGAAVGTPVVAVFGPSDPARYAHRGPLDRVVRIDLPCSPCNRIRRPPERCVGHTPDCLAGITSDAVFEAATARARPVGRPHGPRRSRMTEAVFIIDARMDAARSISTPTGRGTPRSVRPSTPIAWIKSLRDARVDGAAAATAASRSAATRSGGSRSCTCTSSRSIVDAVPDAGRARSARRPRAATRAALGLGDGTVVRRSRRRSPRRGASPITVREHSGVLDASDSPRWTRSGVWTRRRRARLAPPRARQPSSTCGHARDSRSRSSTARSGARAGDGSAEAYIGPVLTRSSARLDRAALHARSASARATNFRARRWWHPRACAIAAPDTRRTGRAYAPLRDARGRREACGGSVTAMRRALWQQRRSSRAIGRSVAATAGRSFARSSRASRCCSSRGRRARWTKPARRSTRCGPRVVVTYAEAGGWGRALVLESRRRGHSLGRPAARVHLPPLAELPARAGRDDDRSPTSRPIAASRVRRSRCSSTSTPRAPRPRRTLSDRCARRDRQPAARCARRSRRAR